MITVLMHACMCVCIHAWKNLHVTHACMHTRERAHTHVCRYTHTHIHIYTYIHCRYTLTYICTRRYTQTHIYKYTHTHIHRLWGTGTHLVVILLRVLLQSNAWISTKSKMSSKTQTPGVCLCLHGLTTIYIHTQTYQCVCVCVYVCAHINIPTYSYTYNAHAYTHASTYAYSCDIK